MPKAEADRVELVASLQEFFKDSVDQAMAQQGVRVDDMTAYYVVNLLTLFSRSESFFEHNGGRLELRPLAIMLADAAQASTTEQRNAVLQRIGDVSLFVAGFFSDSLALKKIDVDYYVRMGGSAYGVLSDNVRGSLRGRVFSTVFAELAEKFQDFVDVVGEVKARTEMEEHIDVLRVYEIWLRTGSRRAARLLRRAGIEPRRDLDADIRH